MHKIVRLATDEPSCLQEYDYREQRWCDLNKEHKSTIKGSLRRIQGNRCAYCEGPLYSKGHIEHFRRKNTAHFPQFTFKWDNLFLACDSRSHCGHYKDRPNAPHYSPNDLIKPDCHNPDEWLYFHSTGEVRVLSRACEHSDSLLANETIRVFNLNDPALMANRRRALKIYLNGDESILEELLQWSPNDRQEYIDQEMVSIIGEPYCTTVRHFLGRAIP